MMDPDPDEHVHPGLETIQWGNRDAENKSKILGLSYHHSNTIFNSPGSCLNCRPRQDESPAPGYNAFSEMARKMVAGDSACAMFCGGKKCKYCTPDNWKPEQMAINGLFSHWVTDNILAMARPTTKAIENFKILDQMKKNNIKTIINVQMTGEHANCGEGLEPGGFSYSPQLFMENQFYFYNFGWEDYGVTSLHSILDMVKVMQFGVSEGKVAIHCHAGLGRTGLLIACYLVFNNRMTAPEAIHFTRSKRPGSIQTSQQMETVYQFEKFITPFRVIFPARKENFHEFSLKQFLARQKLLLHGFEGRKLKFIPKIVYICCERLLEMANKGQALARVRSAANLRSSSVYEGPDVLDTQEKSASLPTLLGDPVPVPAIRKSRGKNSFSKEGSTPYLTELADEESDSIETSHSNGKASLPEGEAVEASVTKKSVRKKSSRFLLSAASRKSDKTGTADGKNEHPKQGEHDKEVNGMNGEQPQELDNDMDAESSKRASFISCTDAAVGEGVEAGTQNGDANFSSLKSFLGTFSADTVVEAMVSPDSMGGSMGEAQKLEEELNDTDLAWNRLAHEQRPELVSRVMWDWFDQLKEPVLIAQELNAMVQHVKDPKTALLKIEKSTRTLFEYLLRVVMKLQPEHSPLRMQLLHHLLGHLTHQVVIPSPSMYEMSQQDVQWPQMKPSLSQALCDLTCNILNSYATETPLPSSRN